MNADRQLDFTSAMGFKPGYRLDRLEVYNWGTFDGQIHTLTPAGGTSLLTGESGSGKSTLVDALLTLLMPPRRVSFNKAADASARERNLTSYVRGYYGQRRGLEGTGQAEALRGFDSYTVVLAAFHDPGLNSTVTLAKALRFRDEAAPPIPLYVAAQCELSIKANFVLDEGGFQSLKKRLVETDKVQAYDDYLRYGEYFRRLLGIREENTLDLFQQTVAMKKVDALTDFVRENMLEDPEIQPEIDKLVSNFHELSEAYAAVLRAKAQIQKLDPLVSKGKQRLTRIAERELIDLAKLILPAWLAEQQIEIIDAEKQRLDTRLQQALARITETERQQAQKSEAEEQIKNDIYASGGAALESLKVDISRAEKAHADAAKKRLEYTRLATILELQTPNNLAEYELNRTSFAAIKAAQEDKRSYYDDQLQGAAVVINDRTSELTNLRSELNSLRQRSSSIPRQQIDLRKKMCNELKLTEAELPFVGELIEVKESEASWEGAIERLLHSFGLSLLVPENLYPRVMEWVDKTNLESRLIYYRVATTQTTPTDKTINVGTVADKLNIKPESIFFSWLRSEIIDRFPHAAAENAAAFRREPNALSINGQIKTRGGRHEKDDRFAIADRARYILGFSNERKIAVLALEEQACAEALSAAHTARSQINEEARHCQDLLTAVQMIEMSDSFEDIDTSGAQQLLTELRERLAILEAGNDRLAALNKKLEELKIEQSGLKEKLAEQNATRYELEATIKTLEADKELALATILSVAEANPSSWSKRSDADKPSNEKQYLDKNALEALQQTSLNLKNLNIISQLYGVWLDTKNKQCSDYIEKTGNDISKQMTEFNALYYEETREISVELDSLPDYIDMLEHLKRDDLPSFEARFKKILNENTINQIALFQAQLENTRGTIRGRIEQINRTLHDIDYNDGRYIRLEYDEAQDQQVRDFRAELRACMEGALGDNSDDYYAETKFLQVQKLIDRFRGRPGETEADARWTQKVTDVRNWFSFAASERWRETDEEYEHYTDSGGKSGGQKEKLAYMVLAASLVYHYGLSEEDSRSHSFRLVVIDEAFLKSSDESAKFGLELFRTLDLQLLIVTPLLKIHTIEPFISHVGFVSHDDITHKSRLRNLTIGEYLEERAAREAANCG